MKIALITTSLMAFGLTLLPAKADKLTSSQVQLMYETGIKVGFMQAACSYYVSDVISREEASWVINDMSSRISSSFLPIAKKEVMGPFQECEKLFK